MFKTADIKTAESFKKKGYIVIKSVYNPEWYIFFAGEKIPDKYLAVKAKIERPKRKYTKRKEKRLKRYIKGKKKYLKRQRRM